MSYATMEAITNSQKTVKISQKLNSREKNPGYRLRAMTKIHLT